METDGWLDDTSFDYIQKKNRKEGKKGIFPRSGNPRLDSVWIKDLRMLYYSILDDELI